MKKRTKIIIAIAIAVLALGALAWYFAPFSYTLDEDVEFSISYTSVDSPLENKFIIIDDEEQRNTLIELVEGLKLTRWLPRHGNNTAATYMFLRANCSTHPYLGFHLKREDLDIPQGQIQHSTDSNDVVILNAQELIRYLDEIIARREESE